MLAHPTTARIVKIGKNLSFGTIDYRQVISGSFVSMASCAGSETCCKRTKRDVGLLQ